MSNEDGLGIYPYGDHRMRIFDEVSWPPDIVSVEETGPFFQIGFWMGGELVIDGPTGHALRVPTEPGEEHHWKSPAPISSRSATMAPRHPYTSKSSTSATSSMPLFRPPSPGRSAAATSSSPRSTER
ncbi:hypothetical protein [Streptomyces sp. BP-8]|uniref:Uncharacterized protein n=1 Tax=Streptomyces sirii TaxID=3127701 RepID=A0ABZ2QQB1_9ACTN